MDMGPYYLAILVNCLGPIEAVAAASRIGAARRTVTAPGRVVDHIDVEVTTHASAVLTFASGAIGTALMSFDLWDTELPRIELYGTEGTLSLPNPNNFDGDVRLKRHADDAWTVLPPTVPAFGAVDTPEQHRRGLGVRDLANAIEGGTQLASAPFAFHVLEALCAIDEASSRAATVRLASTCARPLPRDPD
jgi:predicted dehydrogenase